MKIVELTPALLKDFLSRPIRPEDVQEWADAGLDVRKDCAKNFKPAQHKRCVVYDHSVGVVDNEVQHEEQVVAIWACRVDEGIGTLSLVGSDRPELVVPIHQEFSREEWPRIKELAPILQAYPSVANIQHHKWLRHFGFREVGAPIKIGSGHFQRWVWNSAEA